MLSDLLALVKCPICIEGSMRISLASTFDMFSQEFNLEDLDTLEDGIIEQYWTFVCDYCGAKQKFNFRDIERMARKELSKRILTLKATAELNKTINVRTKYLIYCGVCNGYDSNGACPQMVYDDCKLRRMPSGL